MTKVKVGLKIKDSNCLIMLRILLNNMLLVSYLVKFHYLLYHRSSCQKYRIYLRVEI